MYYYMLTCKVQANATSLLVVAQLSVCIFV